MKIFKKICTTFLAFMMTLSCVGGFNVQNVNAADVATATLSYSQGSHVPVEINEVVGSHINHTLYIRLNGATNANAFTDGQDLSSWCTNLPAGLKLQKNGPAFVESGDTIYLSLVGTASAAYDGILTIKIPNNELKSTSASYEIPAEGLNVVNLPNSHIKIKSNQSAPIGLSSSDGVISGVNTTMEYSIDNGTNWMTVTGTEISNLDNVVVKIRYKETSTHFSSPITEITVAKKLTVSGSITGDDLPTKLTFSADGKNYIATVTNSDSRTATYSIDLYGDKSYMISAIGVAGLQEYSGVIALTHTNKSEDIVMVKKASTDNPPGITGNLTTDIAARSEYTIELTDAKVLGQLLQDNGIPHVGSCVNPKNVRMTSGHSYITLGNNSLITGIKVGTSTLMFDATTLGCAYYGSQNVTNATITIKIVLPENAKAFLVGVLNGTANGDDVSGFYTNVTKDNINEIIAGENTYKNYTDLEKAAINAKLSPSTYEDMVAAAKFLSHHTDDNQEFLNTVDSSTVDQLLDEESNYNALTSAQKALVNHGLDVDGKKEFPAILQEAKKFVEEQSQQFKNQFLNHQDDYDNILASQDTYQSMSQAEKDAIDQLLSPQTYLDVLDEAYVTKFVAEHMTQDDGSIVIESKKETFDYIIYGEDDYAMLTPAQQAIVNEKLHAAGANQSYADMLKAAKQTVDENSSLFIESYVSDNFKNLYLETNANNYEQIISGSEIWNQFTQAQKDAVNQKLIADGSMTYEELVDFAKVIQDHTNQFIDDYLKDGQDNIYKAVNAKNYEHILSGQSNWEKLSQNEKAAIDDILVANGGKTYEELIQSAKAIQDTTNQFMNTYLKDSQDNIYKNVNAKNYKQILSGKADWDQMTQYEKDVINHMLVAEGGQTYEELIQSAKTIQNHFDQFVKTYLMGKDGTIYQKANADNYKQILSGKADWEKLSQNERDAINDMLVAHGGQTYEQLLKLAIDIQHRVETGDETFFVLYSLIGMMSLGAILVLKKKTIKD